MPMIADIFQPVFDGGDVGQPHRRIVAIGDDQRAVFGRRRGIVVGHRPGSACCPARSRPWGCWAGIGGGDGGAHILQPDAVFEQGARIELDPDGRQRRPGQGDIAHARRSGTASAAGCWRPGRRSVPASGSWRSCARIMIGKSGRIELAIDRIGAQRSRQIGPRRADRGLHVARGPVNVAVDVELQHDLGGAAPSCARSSRLTSAMAPRWRSSGVATRGRHGFRAGAGHAGADHDGGQVDIGQRRHRQQEQGADAGQRQPRSPAGWWRWGGG